MNQPADEDFVRAWFTQLAAPAGTGPGEAPPEPAAPLLARLRDDPSTRRLLPRLFEIDAASKPAGAPPWKSAFAADPSWPTALAALADEGVIDRGMLIDRCLARLGRRDGHPGTAAFLQILGALAPTAQESAARVAACARLLTAGPSAAAPTAHRMLKLAESAGLVEPETVLEISAAVLREGRRDPVRAHLLWLGDYARRRPAQAGRVLRIAAPMTAHPALDIQERATDLIARRSATVDRAELEQLRSTIRGLNPQLAGYALPQLGPEDAVPGEPADAPPALVPPRPVPVPEPLGSADVAAVLEPLMALMSCDSPQLEQLLAGVATLAYEDRAELADTIARIKAWPGLEWKYPPNPLLPLIYSSVTAHGRDRPGRYTAPETQGFCFPDLVLAARVQEVARGLGAAPVPCLLATPTERDGLIDPAVLVARVRRFEAAGRDPWPLDFEQALLRLPDYIEDAVIAAAAALRSPAGRALRRHLHGLALSAEAPDARPPARRPTRRRGLLGGTRRLFGRPADAWAPSDALSRLLHAEPAPARHSHYVFRIKPTIVHWPAIAPARPDLVAAHALPFFAAADIRHIGHLPQALLPVLAEAPGPFGPATRLALAYGLGSRDVPAQADAAAALVTLAARDRLDSIEIGNRLGELIADRTVRLVDVAATLEAAAGAGAHRQVWAVLAAALSRFLGADLPPGVPEFLAFSTKSAVRAGARGSFPALDAVAGDRRRTRLQTEARRLRRTLVD